MNNVLNKILKLAKISVLVFGIAVAPFALTGCKPSVDDNNTDNGVVSPEPDNNQGADSVDKEPEDEPDKKPEEDPAPEDDSKYETTQFSREDIIKFLKLIRDGKNYTLNVTPVTGNDFGKTLKRDGGKIYFAEGQLGKACYATNDGTNDINIRYNSTNSKWEANIVESSDSKTVTVGNVDTSVPSFLNSISYKLYNTKTGEYKATIRNEDDELKDVSIFYKKDSNTFTSFEMTVKDNTAPYTVVFTELGTTSVVIPEYTLNGSEIDDSKNVLTVENGNYNFDYELIKPIVENWLKGENSYETDLVDKFATQRNCETEQVLFMNLSKDNFELYVVYKDLDENQRYITQFNIYDRQLYGELASVNSMTEKELTEYFKSSVGSVSSPIGSKDYSVDYITTDSDFASHEAQFNALSSKVVERMQTVGEQGYSVENNGTKADCSGYNIVSAFKTVPTSPNSLDFKCEGLNQSFNMVYLAEKNGQYELVDFLVVSSVERGLSNLYTNITDYDASTARNWMVSKLTTTEMTVENGDLYIDRIG